ncbi:unnamed protein product [Paramecium octaurelia]|uniref:Uncharacterized protein n=1 Tax=Paramecium octaurelia TaxID=43137 RepID=A0A8S1W816_PAROT|nr:unnamed protein product [Paramecium octaurelia]
MSILEKNQNRKGQYQSYVRDKKQKDIDNIKSNRNQQISAKFSSQQEQLADLKCYIQLKKNGKNTLSCNFYNEPAVVFRLLCSYEIILIAVNAFFE